MPALLACLILALLGVRGAAAADFPPITDAERALTSVPGEPNAPAVVLFKKGEFLMAGYGLRSGLSSSLPHPGPPEDPHRGGEEQRRGGDHPQRLSSGSTASRRAPSCRTAGSSRSPPTPSSSARPRARTRRSPPPWPSPRCRWERSSTTSTSSGSTPSSIWSPGTSPRGSPSSTPRSCSRRPWRSERRPGAAGPRR